MTLSLTAAMAIAVAMVAHASPVETPDKGSPLRQTILDGLRASKQMQELSQAWHAKVIFTDVNIRRSGDWAWVTASPMSEKDNKNRTESISGVMRNSQGKWAIVEFRPDSIPSADDPEEEFRSWQTGFMKKHPECPVAIFPSKL
jgi:SnoaL-like domain